MNVLDVKCNRIDISYKKHNPIDRLLTYCLHLLDVPINYNTLVTVSR